MLQENHLLYENDYFIIPMSHFLKVANISPFRNYVCRDPVLWVFVLFLNRSNLKTNENVILFLQK